MIFLLTKFVVFILAAFNIGGIFDHAFIVAGASIAAFELFKLLIEYVFEVDINGVFRRGNWRIFWYFLGLLLNILPARYWYLWITGLIIIGLAWLFGDHADHHKASLSKAFNKAFDGKTTDEGVVDVESAN